LGLVGGPAVAGPLGPAAAAAGVAKGDALGAAGWASDSGHADMYLWSARIGRAERRCGALSLRPARRLD
jgi:cellulase/cellobiase CelA1